MSEGEPSIFPQKISQKISREIGERLLRSHSYADLDVSDLVQSGLVEAGETFPSGISRLLKFNTRIADLSWDSLCQKIPPPTDSYIVENIVPNLQISETDEQQTRLFSLGVGDISPETNPIKTSFEHAQNDLRKLSLQIVSKAKSGANMLAFSDSSKNKISNPEKILAKYPPEQFMDLEPVILNISDVGYCFALPIPQKSETKTSVILTPSQGEYLVVIDSKLNSELADYVFGSNRILKYLLLKQVSSTQTSIESDLEHKIRSIARDKYPKLEATVNSITSPLAKHAFDLIKSELDHRNKIYLTEVHRDRHDVNSVLGYANPLKIHEGSESGFQQYSVSNDDTGGILFEWDEVRWGNVEHKRGVVDLSEEGELVYSDLDVVEEPSTELGIKVLSNDSDNLKYLFHSISMVFNLEMLKQFGTRGVEDATELVSRLNQTHTLSELFSNLRATQIYPHMEFFFGTKPNTFVIDTFYDPLQTPKAKLS